MRILHVSDVHIRSLTRHDEQREVFTDLIRQAREDKVDHIFVGGDIYHSKTSGITAEYVEFMVWWLNSLAEVAPLHIILGNHDLNEKNKDRQDAVSPIVKAINNPRINLYKNSGVYNFAPGYNFCVFSIVDPENWNDVHPVPGEFNIFCFHGPVVGSTLENGWEVHKGLPLEFFNESDVTMLGDIHKLQFLDEREYEIEIDESELKNYPGAKIVKARR